MKYNRRSSANQNNDTFRGKCLEVTARNNESPERLLKRFMKKVKNDGILKLHSDSEIFVKPSVVRRRKRQKAAWMAKTSQKK